MSAETVPSQPSPKVPAVAAQRASIVARMSVAEYMEWERTATIRHEYVNGFVVAMSGETVDHNQIAGNIYMGLELAFGARPCRTFVENIRVRVSPTQYRYPDIVALCGKPALDDNNPPVLLNPSIIMEVLSPSTQDFGRNGKFLEYRQIAGLTDYVLVEQDLIAVVHYIRQSQSTWKVEEYRHLTDVITFAALNVSLTLADVYRKVKLPSIATEPGTASA
jgi:Uma2 family endonuclease